MLTYAADKEGSDGVDGVPAAVVALTPRGEDVGKSRFALAALIAGRMDDGPQQAAARAYLRDCVVVPAIEVR